MNHEQGDGEGRQPLFGWRVLRAGVDLLPQRQAVVHPAVVGEVERHTRDVVEDEVGHLVVSADRRDQR